MAQVIEKTITLDLSSLDGNAFVIMGAFKRQSRREGWQDEETKAVLDECMTGDYDHLLQTIMAHTE